MNILVDAGKNGPGQDRLIDPQSSHQGQALEPTNGYRLSRTYFTQIVELGCLSALNPLESVIEENGYEAFLVATKMSISGIAGMQGKAYASFSNM